MPRMAVREGLVVLNIEITVTQNGGQLSVDAFV